MITVEFPKALFISTNDRFPHWAEKARRTKALRTLGMLAARETEPIPTPTRACAATTAAGTSTRPTSALTRPPATATDTKHRKEQGR